MSAILALYDALADRLKGDATLMALLPGGVHSGSVPTSSTPWPRPYLTITNADEDDAGTLERYGNSTSIEIDVFGAKGSHTPGPVNLILNRVETLLRTPLVLTGFSTARLRRERFDLPPEEDKTRHGVLRLTLFSLETA